MLPGRRHELILRAVRSEGSATISGLADSLGVSIATVRRDLVTLDEEGLLKRVYGGAASVEDRDEPFADVAAVRVD
jgi:DeoR/GlpR family transcriptional regulator of sugar metabolism